MQADLQNKNFWKELEINPSANLNLNENLDSFYKKYQKDLRNRGYPGDKKRCLSQLRNQTDPTFLLDIFFDRLERGITSPQISQIKLEDFRPEDINALEHFHRLLVRRLNSLDNSDRLYYSPEVYPGYLSIDGSNKIRFIVKKKTGNVIKSSRRKGFYKKYIEKLVIVTKKDNHWIIRSSFKNMKEKRIIKGIFQSRRIFLTKESSLRQVFNKISTNTKILALYGIFEKDSREFNYSLSGEEINDLTTEEFNFLFGSDTVIEKLEYLKFVVQNKNIAYKLISHKFNVRHLRLITTGMTPHQIWESAEILKNNLQLGEDIYIVSPEDKDHRLRYILNAKLLGEMDLSLLSNEIEYLQSIKITQLNYRDSFKACLNVSDECLSFEDKDIFETSETTCPNCGQKLAKFGSYANVKINGGAIKKYVKSILKNNEFSYEGTITKQFNRIKIPFMKFTNVNNKKFLIYFCEHKRNLGMLAKLFSEKSLPVLFITLKEGIAQNLNFDRYSIGKIDFPNFFISSEKNDFSLITSVLSDIILRQNRWKLQNFEYSLRILRDFSNNLDLSKIEGQTLKTKGRTFERLTTHSLKAISKSWVELGQIFQNRSVPDGLGYLNFEDNKFVYGYDSKLKGESARGLSSKERENQKNYIEEYRKKARGYGGLKSWIILIKSEGDYAKFKNSIEKLKSESGFENILLLGVGPLIKICDIYQNSTRERKININMFDKFLYKLFKYRGNITQEKIERIYSQVFTDVRTFDID